MPIAIRRVLAVTLASLVALVLAPAPSQAGGWALTVLDPLPDRVEAGRTYTVGMWLLQHGFHPYTGGDLGAVELHLVGADGKSSGYPAVALKDPAHFAATVVVPRDGRYTVVAKQGWFADYRIGTLTVPGTLAVLPVPVELTAEHIAKYWTGAAHPPILPVDTSRDVFNEPAAAPPRAEPPVQAAAAQAEPISPSTSRLTVLAGVAALLVVGTVLLSRRRLMARRRPT
ncbi:hypothetical protein [Phytohabitans houttuyneae]|uniref:Gram-positive cocci surface proteins LPxTG domain-containing protein n=1 Tax=Phytohabitans houttuyneae TaxID=1076126 RepID=A0A6V8KLI5_9ACTN|nr:hypothetical protein [Phytohabitans houttuyneae]GFJ83281.1 hypothetical protein Phou_074610 [Phytohabitans houttuyneae]